MERDWKRPPVIEVVLGLQFDPIATLRNGHLGWFWREVHAEFPSTDDAAPIHPLDEAFDDPSLGIPGLVLGPAMGNTRLRMVSADGTRMVQVQNGWFVVNWVKCHDDDYPGYSRVKVLFDDMLRRFSDFVTRHLRVTVNPNLWEVTYIDRIPRGTVWHTTADLPRVFPGLFGVPPGPLQSPEAVNATWSWRVSGQESGRLRVTLQSVRGLAPPHQDMLLMQSTARGPLGPDGAASLSDCLNAGHRAVVDTFMAVTSNDARRYWETGQ